MTNFDNSVDLKDIAEKINGFKAALNEESGIDKLFFPVASFYSAYDWSKESKDIFKRETFRYLDQVLVQRTIEVQKKEVSL